MLRDTVLILTALAAAFVIGMQSARAQVLEDVQPGAYMIITQKNCTAIQALEGGPSLLDCPQALQVPAIDMTVCQAEKTRWETEAKIFGTMYLELMGADPQLAPDFIANCVSAS